MTAHAIVSQLKWLEARRDLLAAEKDLSHRSDQVAELRRKLPWVRIEKPYVFEGRSGKASMVDLFAGRSQLLVQHFMLAPGWKEGCKSCSFMADHTDSMTGHLAQRDVTFVAISRAPYSEIEPFRKRMGWKFNWVSSNANSFNFDFRVSFTAEEKAKGEVAYNYGTEPYDNEEQPGVSVFHKDTSGDVFHTYSTYGRGVEVMMGTYRMLDLTPKGRDEAPGRGMAWVRHHDRYQQDATGSTASCCGGEK